MAHGYRSYVPSELLGGVAMASSYQMQTSKINEVAYVHHNKFKLQHHQYNITRSNTVHVCTCTSTLSFELYSLDDNYVYASHDHVSQDSQACTFQDLK